MKRTVERMLSVILILLVMFAFFPAKSFADENQGVYLNFAKSNITENKVVLVATVQNPAKKPLFSIQLSVVNRKTGEKKTCTKSLGLLDLREEANISFDLAKDLKMKVMKETEYSYALTTRFGLLPFTAEGRFSTPGPKPEAFTAYLNCNAVTHKDQLLSNGSVQNMQPTMALLSKSS